jgi:murein DD-endopeptidase MepM/ murein hydrolase activator NlpD
MLLPPTRGPGTPIVTPTPDRPHSLPTPRAKPGEYIVQAGDTLGSIADRHGVGADAIVTANNLTNPDQLEVGQVLVIPAASVDAPGPATKVIPDSELVYGPASIAFDLPGYVNYRRGYLAAYSEEVDGETLSGAAIVKKVAQDYSINPRLLLALIEHHSQWVGNANPPAETLDYPLGYYDPWRAGLYRQLAWTADELNSGYYAWRTGSVSAWVLADGSVVTADPTINAGTAAIQYLFSQLDERAAWDVNVGYRGLFQTYFFLFGHPFDQAIEPLLPPNLAQPQMILPFPAGETWQFTGGPHGGWGNGSAWAALDFAPPGEPKGCAASDAWVTAVADGLILRARQGAVIQDLDGDGYEQTGWVILYMHIESRERVAPGTMLKAGERVGHPSCEGGMSNGTHLHIARKYNGEWIPADAAQPFVLSGWQAESAGRHYDGYLRRAGKSVEAWEDSRPENQILH